MKYISVGTVSKAATEKNFAVTHGGYTFNLTGELARMWASGRYQFSQSENIYEEKALKQLLKMGLVISAEDLPSGNYRALIRCTIVPSKQKHPYWGLSARERIALKWLREAGLRLTIGELVFLMDQGILPLPHLLGEKNRQRLVETIYNRHTIFDNILESLMEFAPTRERTVNTVLRLLSKKRIVLL